ncbi:S1C family serine protease [Pseudonocardia abyssalis]|nr:trypsin-like peptidase domain-containing protein [Pseudonocardia abyssalis]
MPPGPPAAHPEPVRPARRGMAGLVAVAIAAAALGGGVGGFVGYEVGSPATASALGMASPAGDGTVAQVAGRVLPSVVQLTGARGEGSGIVLSADGLLLTNNHVVTGAGSGLTAIFSDGSRAPVQVVGTDPSADLAVVRAQGVSGLTPIEIGSSSGLQVGQQVVAVGSPLGLAGTVTTGIVSALDRPVAAGNQAASLEAIQTDAAINPGNSGGPLVDMAGRVVGINSAIATVGGSGSGRSGSIGLGFAIPIDQAARIADQLARTGQATRAVLGVALRDATPTGAELTRVQAGGAADQAGLQVGDVVTAIDDRPVGTADALAATINSRAPGTASTLAVTGPAGTRDVPITFGAGAA